MQPFSEAGSEVPHLTEVNPTDSFNLAEFYLNSDGLSNLLEPLGFPSLAPDPLDALTPEQIENWLQTPDSWHGDPANRGLLYQCWTAVHAPVQEDFSIELLLQNTEMRDNRWFATCSAAKQLRDHAGYNSLPQETRVWYSTLQQICERIFPLDVSGEPSPAYLELFRKETIALQRRLVDLWRQTYDVSDSFLANPFTGEKVSLELPEAATAFAGAANAFTTLSGGYDGNDALFRTIRQSFHQVQQAFDNWAPLFPEYNEYVSHAQNVYNLTGTTPKLFENIDFSTEEPEQEIVDRVIQFAGKRGWEQALRTATAVFAQTDSANYAPVARAFRNAEPALAPQLAELMSDSSLHPAIFLESMLALEKLGNPAVAPALVELLPRGSFPTRLLKVLETLNNRTIADRLTQIYADLHTPGDVAENIAALLKNWQHSSQLPTRSKKRPFDELSDSTPEFLVEEQPAPQAPLFDPTRLLYLGKPSSETSSGEKPQNLETPGGDEFHEKPQNLAPRITWSSPVYSAKRMTDVLLRSQELLNDPRYNRLPEWEQAEYQEVCNGLEEHWTTVFLRASTLLGRQEGTGAEAIEPSQFSEQERHEYEEQVYQALPMEIRTLFEEAQQGQVKHWTTVLLPAEELSKQPWYSQLSERVKAEYEAALHKTSTIGQERFIESIARLDEANMRVERLFKLEAQRDDARLFLTLMTRRPRASLGKGSLEAARLARTALYYFKAYHQKRDLTAEEAAKALNQSWGKHSSGEWKIERYIEELSHITKDDIEKLEDLEWTNAIVGPVEDAMEDFASVAGWNEVFGRVKEVILNTHHENYKLLVWGLEAAEDVDFAHPILDLLEREKNIHSEVRRNLITELVDTRSPTVVSRLVNLLSEADDKEVSMITNLLYEICDRRIQRGLQNFFDQDTYSQLEQIRREGQFEQEALNDIDWILQHR